MPDITRRDFLKLMKGTGIAICAGAVAAPVVAYFYPTDLESIPPSLPSYARKVNYQLVNQERFRSVVILPL